MTVGRVRCPLPAARHSGTAVHKVQHVYGHLYLDKELGFFMEVFNCSIYIETVLLVSLYLALIYVNFGVT